MTDIPREGYARRKRLKRVITAVLLGGVPAILTWALSGLKPAAPSVERTSVWVGEAERGTMVIDLTQKCNTRRILTFDPIGRILTLDL